MLMFFNGLVPFEMACYLPQACLKLGAERSTLCSRYLKLG